MMPGLKLMNGILMPKSFLSRIMIKAILMQMIPRCGVELGFYNYSSHPVTDSLSYSLKLNELDVPLKVEWGTVHVISEVVIAKSNNLHVVFKINNEIVLNKTILVPSDITLIMPTNMDFHHPVEIAWSTAYDPDYQYLSVSTSYDTGHGLLDYPIHYFVDNSVPHLLLNAQDYLDYYVENGYTPNLNRLYLYYVVMECANYQEQNNIVVGVSRFQSYSVNPLHH
jgi:hypothetical protein